MIILSAKDITKTYGIETILTEVSFYINQGDRIGIVGANGAGKSTLLNILSGALPYDKGEIFMSNDIKIGYLQQQNNFNSEKTVYQEMLSIFDQVIKMESELAQLSHDISELSKKGKDTERLLHQYDDLLELYENSNGYSYKSEINGILNSMAFSEEAFHKKVSLLSGGERTRLALASLLLKKPDLLLLDEPTNHLDIGTLKWLEQYLKNYTGTILLISHDRYFLDQTTNRIFEIENHTLYTYEGNYTEYVEKKAQRQADQLKQYENQQTEIKRQEEMIRRFKQRGTEKLAKRAQSREKRLQQMERLEKPRGTQKKMRLDLKQNFQSGNDVVFAEGLSKSFGRDEEKRQLFSNVDLDIKRGERICLVGPNGIGKTTLLKIIMGLVQPDEGRLKIGHNVVFGYYDQEQGLLNGSNTVLNEVHSAYRLYDETELRGLLGRFIFKDDMVFQQVSSLSGGEKARLSLLKVMLSGANLLLMDEPTNHLDIASKEVFENALLDYPGTVIAVSHDRYFLNKVATRILELSFDGITNFLGGYDYYMEKKQSLGSGKSYLEELGKQGASDSGEEGCDSKEEELSSAEARRRDKEIQAQKKRLERQKNQQEKRINEMESRIEWLQNEMCKEEIFSDHEKLLTYDTELQAVKQELEEAYISWMELSES
jgi:ATP-binding cassette subfamily F protein 3